MPRLITITALRKIIATLGLVKFLQGLKEALKVDFARQTQFYNQPRHVIHYPHGVMELMPAADNEFYAVKYVNGHPTNPKCDKATVVAIGLLADVASGYPLMISEMTLLTALRTAVVSVLAAEYLALPSATTMALIGTGSQAEFQALAFHYLLNINTIRYYDIDPAAMAKFSHNLEKYPIKLIECNSISNAIQSCQIITTATAAKKKAALIKSEMLTPGMHINAIGGDAAGKTELDPLSLKRCKIVVEYLKQTQEEGEIQAGFVQCVYAELWQLITQQKPGRESSQEITLFDSVGFALEDYAALRYLWQQANHLGIGQQVELLPQLSDAKDLFGQLQY